MLRLRLRAKASAKAKTKLRPPQELTDVLSEPESEFRRRVAQVESLDLFRRLQDIGVVKRRGLRGWIPRYRYQEHMDDQLLRFVETYGLSDHPDWYAQFTAPDAVRRTEALARKYGAPVGEVRRFVQYLRSAHAAACQPGPWNEAASVAQRWEPPDYTPWPAQADAHDAITVAQAFVQAHGVSELEFVRDFLWGEESPDTLAQRYGADVTEVQRLLESLESVQVASAISDNAGLATTRAPRAATPDIADAVVAEVEQRAGEGMCLRFDADAGYMLRYRIVPEALEKEPALRRDPQVHALLAKLRLINQRRSVVSRIAAFIFEHQRGYFETRDPLALRPLSQAEIARALGEHQSTISRAVRRKAIRTTQGVFELQYFCQKKQAVIGRVAARFPNATAEQLRRMLLDRYRCKLSRRTVAYHLARLKATWSDIDGGAAR